MLPMTFFARWNQAPVTKKSLAALIIVFLLVGCGFFVYYTGGVRYVFAHSMYLPIIFAAIFFKTRGGLLAGMAAGLILGPYMPIETMTGEMQLTANWLFRMGVFMFVGGFIGYVINILYQTYQEQGVVLEKIEMQRHETFEARKLLEDVLERVSDGFVALDKNWYYTYVNEVAARMLQREKPADLLGKHIWTEYPEGIDQPFYRAYYRAMETQKPIYLEEYYEPWDRWFENRIYPSPEGLTIYFTEITGRKQAEAELRVERNKLAGLLNFQAEMLDTAAIWINTLDNKGNITLWNKAAEQISGYKAEEVMGHTGIWEWLYPDPAYRTEIMLKVREILEQGERVENFETKIKCKDGWQRIISWHSNSLSETGKIIGSIAIGADITEHKNAQKKLQEWHDLMQYIIQHDPNAIAVFDNELRYIYVSRRFLEDYKLKDQNIIGKHHYEVFPEIPKRWRDVHERTLAGEIISSEDDFFKRADGSIDYVRWQCRPWHHSDGTVGGIVLYTEVVTERKKAEAALQKLNQELEDRIRERTVQLEAKNRELETFSYSVSHDLKAPLRGIDGYSRLLLEDYAGKLDEEGRTFVKTIRNAVEQMSRLIDDLLTYSRMEQQPWHGSTVNLRLLVQSVAAKRDGEVRLRGGSLNMEIPDVSVVIDPDGLNLILRNLLDNSLKFSSDAQPPVITIGCSTHEETFILWIRDNGIGFDMQHHDRIFAIFNRLHRAEEYPGTGIGLAMVRKAVERMGGRVWAESEPGKGSTFYLEIPLRKPEQTGDLLSERS
jgi:PAS domain S-box-containing protein